MQCFLAGYTQFLGECVYEENTSDKWHVPRYPTRKHCITSIYIYANTIFVVLFNLGEFVAFGAFTSMLRVSVNKEQLLSK